MYHLQIISRDAMDVQAAVREAIETERIKSFEIDRIRGGLRIRHKKFKGDVQFARTPGPTLVTVRSPNPDNEWQLLTAFIGRLVYHFGDAITGINLQVGGGPPPKSPKRRARKK